MLTDLFHRLRAIFRRKAVEIELDEELTFHIERQTEKYVGTGLTAAEAARRVCLDFGGVDQVKEHCREARGIRWMDEARRNFRYAFRMLAKKPGFALVVIVTLGLGIGANSAVFSAINAVLLRPLPFPESNQLMTLDQYDPRTSNPASPVAPLRLQDWSRMTSTFASVTGYYLENISETSGELPERITRANVAPGFFKAWRVSPAFGRDFDAQEERFGGPKAAIVSQRFWNRRFGSESSTGNRQLRIGATAYPIVGVMPESFLFLNREVDLWFPVPMDAPYAQSRDATWFTVIGRLRPGSTLEQAQADLNAVQSQLAKQYPATDSKVAVRIRRLKEVTIGGVGQSLWILFAAVTLLLLIACTNIAALLLARTSDREQEISIRLSLGASRASIIGQLLTESFVLAVAGSLLGLLIAAGAFQMFRLLAANLPRMGEIRLDWALFFYSLSIAVIATIVSGLFPAVRGTRHNIAGSLAHTGRTLVTLKTGVQWVLVGVQVALSVTLLVGAGLLLRSLDALGRVSPGFESSKILTFRISGNWGETVDSKALARRIETTLESLRALPGVQAAASTVATPGVPFEFNTEFRIVEGPSDPNSKLMADMRIVSSEYFATMQIPIVEGVDCDSASGPRSVLVNNAFVERYLGSTPAIGRHVENVPANPFVGAGSIRGIVANAREEGIHREPGPIVYWCHPAPNPTPLFLIRTEVEPTSMTATIRRHLREIEPARSVYEIMPLDSRLNEAFAENRLRTTLLTLFALAAVSLAAVGVYGTLSYFVSMQRREVGLRIAMGARRGEIVVRFLRQGLGVSLIGIVAGLALAAALGRTLSGMLYGVSLLDPTTFVGVLVLVFLTAGFSSLLPAIRASRVQPMEVLRDE